MMGFRSVNIHDLCTYFKSDWRDKLPRDHIRLAVYPRRVVSVGVNILTIYEIFAKNKARVRFDSAWAFSSL